MLLEKGIFAVHVSAIKKAISVYNFLPIPFTYIFSIAILIVIKVVFVACNVLRFLRYFGFLRNLYISTPLYERLLLPTQFIVQVNKYVGPRYLHKTFISSLQEHNIFFIKMRKQFVAKNKINLLPVSCHHTLFV
jgi:hypothetical protein